MKKFLLLSVLSISFASCYQQKIIVGTGAKSEQKVSQKWNSYFLEGLIPAGVKPVVINELPEKDCTITVKQTFLQGFITNLTYGIYSPTTVLITK